MSSKKNTVQGLDRFSRRHLIHGTTQAFDEAYLRYHDRRLRIFRGEYAYHRRVVPSFKFIEDEEITKQDYVIMSQPFCSNGQILPQTNELLDLCLSLNVPVEIDCAYFGTCQDLEFDFSHEAIKAVSFSLSKSMGLGDIRSGIRYSDFCDAMPISQQNSYNHLPLLSAKIGLYMMEKFDFDYIPTTYRSHQLAVCEALNLEATPCMHLALGNAENYGEFLVDDKYYRIGLRHVVKAHKKGELSV